MAFQVLQEKQQIIEAREILRAMGASSLDSAAVRLMRKAGLLRSVAVGDDLKSWDVCCTVRFLLDRLAKGEPILDIGCFASEVIVALHKLGYTRLTGADLNPRVGRMPYQDAIRYEITDFMQTSFPDASFQAVTSISVIEHGYDGDRLLQEISRLLKPGGYFLASFDYWPDRIDTSDVKFFGMDWMIFSRNEVENLIALAQTYGLYPVGEMAHEAKATVADCGGKQYTFGWLALQKRA